MIKKAGEVDNLRRRSEHATRQTEQRLAQQLHEHQESAAKMAAERDALLRQLEQAKTNSAFDEHNRYDDQMRRPRRTVPTRPKPPAPVAAAAASPAATPKKAQKNLPLGDGFDDDDNVLAVSPTKRRDRSKVATPKQASKRKRLVPNDSPVQALQLSEPRNTQLPRDPPSFTEAAVDIALLRSLRKDDRRFDLLHRLLSRHCSRGDDRILEALTRYAFPSDPEKKLSSIVYDGFSTCAPSANARELATAICRVFVDIWTRCLREKYLAPIYLILDALQFVLSSTPTKTAIAVVDLVVPLIVDSVKLVAIPVYEARNRNEKKSAFLFSPDYHTIVDQIDVPTCLELLYQLATSCVASPSPSHLTHFWTTIPLDFVLLTLLKEQPPTTMLPILSLLSASALPSSLGPIVSTDPATQQTAESNLLSRLTNLFSETLAPTPDPANTTSPPPPAPDSQTWRIRLRVLDVLTHFSLPAHGATVLVTHNLCVGRLIKYLDHAVSALYSRPLAPSQELKIATVNRTMRLLDRLTRANPGFNIKSKLGETLGGLHAYYVALTRLAFSEGCVLEEGIESEVVDMAHDILDDGLSPEEGDALAEVFPSGGSI